MSVTIVLTDGFEIFARQEVEAPDLIETLRDLNARPPRWRTEEPSYREPVDVVCEICGSKHCIDIHGARQ